jgi:hypothetical protein
MMHIINDAKLNVKNKIDLIFNNINNIKKILSIINHGNNKTFYEMGRWKDTNHQ